MRGGAEECANWRPVDVSERYTSLDLLRGFALFGVLLVNLLYFFRVSLFEHIFVFHSHPGWINHAIDLLVSELVEFKAFDLFSLSFGIGIAVQAERAGLRGIFVEAFLARRFAILLAIGACHMVLVSNVDILCLYAICGFVAIPLLRLPAAVLALAGVAAIYLPSVCSGWFPIPSGAVMRAQAAAATHIYSQGSFGTILQFRWHETQDLIVPLLASVAQKTLGMMLLGMAVWRSGVVRDPGRYRSVLWAVCLVAGAIGLVNTTAGLMEDVFKIQVHVPAAFGALGSHVPLAMAYGCALLAWRPSGRFTAFLAAVAGAGRMALTNYLAQSLVFALVFYGWGFGLFGRLDPQTAAAFGVAFYAGQLWFSAWWLRRYRFGPCEWLWRSLTYGRRQPMRQTTSVAALSTAARQG